MIITTESKMSPASKEALLKVNSVREPLATKRDELHVKLNACLKSMEAAKAEEKAIRDQIKEVSDQLYSVDMDRGAIHRAQGIGSTAATDAAAKSISDKY